MNNKKKTRRVAALLVALATLCTAQASVAESTNGVTVTLPNGFVTVTVEDLRVQSTAGPVKWQRSWDGTEWKFNPHWESLSHSWGNLTGSIAADRASAAPGATTPVTDDGCWVLVDEDWQPSTGTVLIGGTKYREAMPPARTTPFNRTIGESALQSDYAPSLRLNVDYAKLCPGAVFSSNVYDMEAVRRINELYIGNDGRLMFNYRSNLDKRVVRALPATPAAAGTTPLQGGAIALNPITIAKGYRWSDRAGDWIDYNTAGQVVAYGERNGNTVWLQRDTGGVLRGVVDATGQVLYTLHYQGGLITEIRDYTRPGPELPARSVKYEYDQFNRLVKVTDTRGSVTRYDYDPDHKLVKITDTEGRQEQFAYSGASVSQRIAPNGGVTDYVFDYDHLKGQFISKIKGPETAAGRRVEDHTHSRVGRLVRQLLNGRTELEVRYDIAARAELRTNARGFTTRLVRNEFEQIVQTVHPDGTKTRQDYDTRTLQTIAEVDEAGIRTLYGIDAKGNRVKKTEAAGLPEEKTTEYERNALGQVIRMTRKGRTERNGSVTPDATWQLEYDQTGQIKKTIDPEGHVRRYVFDRAGSLVEFTDARGHTTRYETDAAGNLLKSTDALGHVRRYGYDKIGNLISEIDGRGKQIQHTYDALNRRIQTTNPVGGIRRTPYNAQGQVIQDTDEDGRTSSAEYDNFLRLTRQIDGLGHVTTYGYQIADGSQAGTLGALNEATEVKYPTYTRQVRYDQRERPTSLTLIHSNSQGVEQLTSGTTYDARGLVKTETDAYGKTRHYRYDAHRQLVETTDALGHKTSAEYDARGNLIQLTDAKGNTHRFEYDRNNRLVKEILPLGQATTYQYDANGNLIERINPNGYKSVYSYDAGNWLSELKQYKADGSLVRTTTLQWDEADNLVAWSDTDTTRPAGQQTASATLVYDDASRKVTETVNYPNPAGGSYTMSYSYGYSAAGKKTKLIWADGTEIAYGYSAHGELQTVSVPGEGTMGVNEYKWLAPAKTTLPGGSVREQGYDGLRNLQSMKVKTPGQQVVLYDSLNRLTEVRDTNQHLIARYGYDPMNRRLWKEEYRDAIGQVLNPTKRTYFLYSDESLIAEATQEIVLNGDGSVSGSVPQTATQYGPKLDSPFMTGVLLIKTRNRVGQDTIGWYQHDHLDTPVQVVNKAGTVLWSAEYTSFGKATLVTDVIDSSVASSLRFPGQYQDLETELHYNWTRYYDSRSGRYVQSDPIGLDGGINTYAYVGANPLLWTDPSGLKAYQCRKPLGGLGGIGTRSGPDIWGNPAYHQYSCVVDADGQISCGGQDRSGNALGSPGKPSEDKYDSQRCEPTFDHRCFDDCLKDEWKKPRPKYGIPFGTDCQEYDDGVNLRCRKKCGVK